MAALACSDDDNGYPGPQQFAAPLEYSNGNLNTGATASNGDIAPSGYNWSEIPTAASNYGFSANEAANLILADDFTVPDGEIWNVSDVEFFAYETGYTGNVSSVNNLKFEIYDSNPTITGAKKVFGDMTTNRLTTSSSAKLYVTLPTTTTTTREVFNLNAKVQDLTLKPGTYWVVWQSLTATNTPHFYPCNKYAAGAIPVSNNAIQNNTGTWNYALDTGEKVDFPFRLKGTKTVTVF